MKFEVHIATTITILLGLCLSFPAMAADVRSTWPQWRGPSRDTAPTPGVAK